MRILSLLMLLAIASLSIAPADAQKRPTVPQEGLGRVHMPISCTAQQVAFDRGLALLYSFWYDRALKTFDRIIANDPGCAIAYWGAAMTFNHPLWSPPTAKDLKDGIGYLERSQNATRHSPREVAYLAAARVLFGDGDPAKKSARDDAYMRRMAELYAAYPDDETALFYALAIEGAPNYYSDARRIALAGHLTEGVRSRQPLHPGALHYIIHGYDTFGYEERALSAARQYAASAPRIPHAVHMPSHTFLALGLWDESNRTNAVAWQAAERDRDTSSPAFISRDFHSLWFLVYGYLQSGQYSKARPLVQLSLQDYREALSRYASLDRNSTNNDPDMLEMLMPVIDYGMYTGDYSLVPPVGDAGLRLPTIAARMQFFALRAMANHDAAGLRNVRAEFARLLDSPEAQQAPKTARVNVQIARNEVEGLALLNEGSVEPGLATLAEATAAEDTLLGLRPPLFLPMPAHELYGLELLRHARYKDAQTELTAALRKTPNRPLALAGLARAARLAGDLKTAGTADVALHAVLKNAEPQARKHVLNVAEGNSQ